MMKNLRMNYLIIKKKVIKMTKNKIMQKYLVNFYMMLKVLISKLLVNILEKIKNLIWMFAENF